MKPTLEVVAVSALIHAPCSDVFAVLTTPEYIKEYLPFSHVTTDWRPGSPIYFENKRQGSDPQGKGRILSVQQDTLVRHTYWNPASGRSDQPENYVTITYTIEEKGSMSELVITQSGVKNERELTLLENEWREISRRIKHLAEAL